MGGKDIAWSPSGNINPLLSQSLPRVPALGFPLCCFIKSTYFHPLIYYVAPTSPVHITTLPTSANLLHVSVESTNEQTGSQILVATTADRRMTLLRPGASLSLHKSYLYVHDSPILSCVTINTDPWVTVSSSMSGQVVLYDHEKNEALEERRDHSKYVVKVVAYRVGNGVHWVATAGWDGKILVYVLHRRQDSSLPALGPPVAVVSLPTNPECTYFRAPNCLFPSGFKAVRHLLRIIQSTYMSA